MAYLLAGSNLHEATDSWSPGGIILGLVIVLVAVGIVKSMGKKRR